MAPIARLGALCACLLASSGDAFFTGGLLPSAGLSTNRAGVARGGCGGLYMAKHRQNKGTKKHVKNRPRKSRPSDRNRKPVEHPIEVVTNGNFPGAPPVYEVLEVGTIAPDTKASVIEALASAEYDKIVEEREAVFAEKKAAFEASCKEAGVELPVDEEEEEYVVPEARPFTFF